MRHPASLSAAYDILYTFGGELDPDRIAAILKNYNGYETQIRAISFDGSLRLGAWVNCDRGDGEWGWLYIAAGDETNRAMIAQAATEAVGRE